MIDPKINQVWRYRGARSLNSINNKYIDFFITKRYELSTIYQVHRWAGNVLYNTLDYNIIVGSAWNSCYIGHPREYWELVAHSLNDYNNDINKTNCSIYNMWYKIMGE